MSSAQAIEAIRDLRLAAHELMNVCRTICDGGPMAIGLATLPDLTEDPHEIELEGFEGGESEH